LGSCDCELVIPEVSYGSCRLYCRSLLAGVVQIEAIQELCKLLVVVSSEAQKDFLGMMLIVVATNGNN